MGCFYSPSSSYRESLFAKLNTYRSLIGVDDVEAMTGLDYFAAIKHDIETEFESNMSPGCKISSITNTTLAEPNIGFSHPTDAEL